MYYGLQQLKEIYFIGAYSQTVRYVCIYNMMKPIRHTYSYALYQVRMYVVTYLNALINWNTINRFSH